MTTYTDAARLDALALVAAVRRRDRPAVKRIADTADNRAMAQILADLLADVIEAQGVTVSEFLDEQADRAIAALHGVGHE